MINNNLQQMLTLQQLAEYRFVTVISFRLAKRKLEAAITVEFQGSSPELDDLMMKCKMLVDTIEEIDACLRKYFVANGRLN